MRFDTTSVTALAPAAHWSLNAFQRLLVGVAVLDTSIQVDTYLFYQEQWAEFGAIGGINVSLATICLVALYAIWLVEAGATATFARRSSLYFNLPLTLYVAVATVSWIVAEEKLLALNSIVLLGQSYLLFTYIANKVQSRDDVVYIASLFAVSLAIQGLAMIGLRVIGHSVSLGPIAGMIGDEMRVGGTIGSPVTGGSFLALMIAPTLSLLVTPVKQSCKLLAIGALVLGGIGLLLTQTRGAWISVGLSTSLFVAIAWYRGLISLRLPIACACAALLLGLVFQESITSRIFGDDEGSAHGRIPLYQMAWADDRRSPANGRGDQQLRGIGGEVRDPS